MSIQTFTLSFNSEKRRRKKMQAKRKCTTRSRTNWPTTSRRRGLGDWSPKRGRDLRCGDRGKQSMKKTRSQSVVTNLRFSPSNPVFQLLHSARRLGARRFILTPIPPLSEEDSRRQTSGIRVTLPTPLHSSLG